MTPLAEKLYDDIEKVLLNHRMSYWQDQDGGSYPLTDMLTPDGHTIQVGYDEIRMICDEIYNQVLVPHVESAERTREELIEVVIDSMPNGDRGFTTTWSLIDFGKKLIERVLPRKKERKPKAWMKVHPTGQCIETTAMEWHADNWKREGGYRVVPLYTEICDEDSVENMDEMRVAFEAWHRERYVASLERSKGGSDYRVPEVVWRWETWQGARALGAFHKQTHDSSNLEFHAWFKRQVAEGLSNEANRLAMYTAWHAARGTAPTK